MRNESCFDDENLTRMFFVMRAWAAFGRDTFATATREDQDRMIAYAEADFEVSRGRNS